MDTIPLQRDSALPLYHQIAEAIRNAIAVGGLAPGDHLPSVRAAAERWGVNLHTVRKAYGELVAEDLLVMDRRGTRVTPANGGAREAESLDTLIGTFVRHGAERFGLTQVQLGQLLIKRGVAGAPVPVHFVECSLEQAAGHCEEIMGRWRVDARPVVLERESDLPAGVVVATYFHYNDIRQRWPDRIEGVRFVAIAPDPALAGALDAGAGEGGPRRLRVCELEESKAVNIAADLSVLLPPERYTLEPYVLRSPSSLPRRRPGEELLVAPRVWGAMDGRTRRQVKLIRYRIRPYELEALGESFGWRPSLGRGIA